ncbi:MAG TPA: hypothetical protein P5055_09575, partial [Candidatus Paceibacterota bacterium]|nr:hypothetical protein [Candidatus Paceibacterota bacterium]
MTDHGIVAGLGDRRWIGLLLGILVVFGGYRPVVARSESGWDVPIILTQVPRQTAISPERQDPSGLLRNDWFDGARLVAISPDGELRVLSQGFHSACDPNLSFDGTKILFAGKKESRAPWRIYEMGLEDRNVRQVSPDHLDARNPIHVSTLFTLDSPEPWFTLVYCGRELSGQGMPKGYPSLYNIKLDGTELRKLTHNLGPSLDPFQMWDGRVIYSASRKSFEPGAPPARLSLFGIHIEGADMEFYGGGQGQRIQHMTCATERGLVVFVEADRATEDGSGQLACVQESRPHVTYRRLTDDPGFRYLHPSPWQGNRLLVSRRSADGKDTCGVFLFDADQGKCDSVLDQPEYHEVQAIVLRPRNRPDGHSTVVNTKATNGVFYCLNAYDADERIRPHLRSGTIRRVRVMEGMAGGEEAGHSRTNPDKPAAHRLIGEAPVESDGSFNVEVPASTPLAFQALDERGLALATCGWVWVQPKETRGCIGCHEDPELTPENNYVQALRRPSNQLTLAPEQRRWVTFRQDIVPILRRSCATAECHGGQGTSLNLPLHTENPTSTDIEKAYAVLRMPEGGAAEKTAAGSGIGRYVDAGRARTSWLVWQLFGT